MRFPLSDWIADHSDCRHNLGQSGMYGSIRRPRITAEERASANAGLLLQEMARSLGVNPGRVFLTHGATEANALVSSFLRQKLRGSRLRCRVRFPEYPPLFDVARWLGFAISGGKGPADLAVVSRPRNPEGDLWPVERLLVWAEGSTHLLIDETFREFARCESVAAVPRAGLWTTGSLTKFFAADDLRVGYVVAPEREARAFEEFVGLVTDELPDESVAGGLSTLRHRAQIRAQVDRVMERNRAAYARARPGRPVPVAPLFFDRTAGETGADFARRAVRSSVLVCPGSFFGDPRGVRVGLTRRSFPEDFAAYEQLRRTAPKARALRGREGGHGARSHPAGNGREKAARA